MVANKQTANEIFATLVLNRFKDAKIEKGSIKFTIGDALFQIKPAFKRLDEKKIKEFTAVYLEGIVRIFGQKNYHLPKPRLVLIAPTDYGVTIKVFKKGKKYPDEILRLAIDVKGAKKRGVALLGKDDGLKRIWVEPALELLEKMETKFFR